MDSLDPKDIRRYNRTQRNKGERRLHPTKNTSPSTPFIRYVSQESYLASVSTPFRFFQEFRKRPEQMNKAVPEAGIAAGEAWRSLTQEEKHVGSLFPFCLRFLATKQNSSRNTRPRPASRPPTRKTIRFSWPSISLRLPPELSHSIPNFLPLILYFKNRLL